MRKIALFLSLLPVATFAEPLKIVTTTAPLADMTEALGGDAVEVTIAVPEGEDPMTFQLGADAIADIQQADLIILNGAGYAQWVSKASLPRAKVVNSAEWVADNFITNDQAVVHSHGGSEHEHVALANTTWLDFDMFSFQVEEVAAALIKKAPEQKAEIEKNLAALQEELAVLDDRAKELLSPLPDAIGSHPRYEYLARAYEIDIRALHWEAEDVPSAEQLAELDKMLAEQPAGLFIWELEPNPEAARLVAERGLKQVIFNPGDNTRGFLKLMRANLDGLAAIN